MDIIIVVVVGALKRKGKKKVKINKSQINQEMRKIIAEVRTFKKKIKIINWKKNIKKIENQKISKIETNMGKLNPQRNKRNIIQELIGIETKIIKIIDNAKTNMVRIKM